MGWGVGAPAYGSGWKVPGGPKRGAWRINAAADTRRPPAGMFAGRVGLHLDLNAVYYGSLSAFTAYLDLHLPTIAAGGVTWLRCDLAWNRIEGTQGVKTWERFDALTARLTVLGIKLLGVLGYPSDWASSRPQGDTSAPVTAFPPASNAQYAAYAAEVVTRYGPAAGGPLAAVELWNEPWLHTFWKPNPDPAAYAALVMAAAPAVRAADPAVTILADCTPYQARSDNPGVPPVFSSAVLAAQPTIATKIDAWNSHPYVANMRDPYDDAVGPFGDFLRSIRAASDAARTTGVVLPMWITEFGWHNALAAVNPPGVTESRAASFTHAAISRALRDWKPAPGQPKIAKLFLYSHAVSSDSTTDDQDGYKIVRANGTYKPVWDVIRAWQ